MTIRVAIAYDGGIDMDLDRRLRRMAGFQGAREVGSGCMLVGPCRRDIEFEFPSVDAYEKFIGALPERVRKL